MTGLRGAPSLIATGPLNVVCFALILATVPLLDRVAPWSVAVFIGALLLRVIIHRRQHRLPSLPAKIALLAGGLGGVALSYGGLLGVEPGLGILLILLSLKLLETNTVRDFQVLVLLGLFLCLCGLFFSQDLTTWLYVGAIALTLSAALIHFHSSPERRPAQSLGTALKMLAQGLPLIALLFLFFPRTQGGFQFQFTRSLSGITGMSDKMSPGSFARLTQDQRIVLRATFPDGDMPSLPQLYWRGAVFWNGDGLDWSGGSDRLFAERQPPPSEGSTIRQSIILEPHGGHWIFALDRPASEIRDSAFQAGGFLRSARPVLAPLRYNVASRLENREVALFPDQRAAALRKPTQISPQVEALVASWKAIATSDREIVDLALRNFRKEKFTYSLEPETYGADALTEFLFQRRTGFCEHYAGAFATLMRIAGLPSRVVVGYHGGEYNRNYVIVRQWDAHAWAEVWLKDRGWLRVDPTNVIAPDRLSSGFDSYNTAHSSGFGGSGAESSTGALGLREFRRELRLFWDNLKYQWDLRVLNYDDETQRTFLALVGLTDFTPSSVLLWIALGVLGFTALLGAWLRRPRFRRVAPVVREYDRFCRILARAGVAREPWEGPVQFATRASRALPEQASTIIAASELYTAARYSREGGNADAFREAVRSLRRLRRSRTPR